MDPNRALGGADLAAVMAAFSSALNDHRDRINRLNVYPVPDGDTGTNMALTVESVVNEILQLDGPAATDGEHDVAAAKDLQTVDYDTSGDGGGAAVGLALDAVSKAIAHGSLMGARGNSGVILSQLLRGLTGVFRDSGSVDAGLLAAAFVAASESAREAVLRPVEGTILTVARAAGEGASSAQGSDIEAVLRKAHEAASDALAHTPEQLPVLARAGVVDAGGTGYLLLIDAFLNVVAGDPLPLAPSSSADELISAPTPVGEADWELHGAEHSDLRYEVMYLLHADDLTIPAFKEVWAGIGDSIVVVGGDGLWNCHIHTDDVGGAIEAALDAGRPSNIRVTDLLEQVEEEKWVREGAVIPAAVQQAPVTRTAVVVVANGDGVKRIFRSLGAYNIIAGGQSMNPSTAEILEMVESTSSPEVIILPNNENIHPVAMQVCELASKHVRTVQTSGIVEGFAALLEFDPEAGADENATAMAASARRIVAGEVTQAVRDAEGPTGTIHQGEWIGLSRNGIEVVGSSLSEATCGLLAKLVASQHELVTLIEGEGSRAAETRRVTEWLSENHPGVAVEVHHGGQPLYPFLISIE